MDAPMMLVFCEAPSGRYQEVVKLASKRLRMTPDCVLTNLVKDGLLDHSYDDFEPREDELYDLDKPLILYARRQIMESVDIVLCSMDTSEEIALDIIGNTRFIFTGGRSWGDYPTEVYPHVSLVSYLDLFEGMGQDNFDYQAAISEIDFSLKQARKA